MVCQSILKDEKASIGEALRLCSDFNLLVVLFGKTAVLENFLSHNRFTFTPDSHFPNAPNDFCLLIAEAQNPLGASKRPA